MDTVIDSLDSVAAVTHSKLLTNLRLHSFLLQSNGGGIRRVFWIPVPFKHNYSIIRGQCLHDLRMSVMPLIHDSSAMEPEGSHRFEVIRVG